MENDDKTHPCALLNGKGASIEYCRTFTRFPGKNLAGCVASQCPSPGRKCWPCLRDDIRPPTTLVGGVCPIHGAVGGLTREQIVKVPIATPRQILDPEATLREQRRAHSSSFEQALNPEGDPEFGWGEKPLPNASVPPKLGSVKKAVPPVEGGNRGTTRVGQPEKTGQKMGAYSPEDLEVRARIGQRALEMSGQIDAAAKAAYGGAALMAQALQISQSKASELRRLQKLSPQVKKKVAEGHLKISAAAVIALYPEWIQPVLFKALKNEKVRVSDLTHGSLRDALAEDKLREHLEALGLE